MAYNLIWMSLVLCSIPGLGKESISSVAHLALESNRPELSIQFLTRTHPPGTEVDEMKPPCVKLGISEKHGFAVLRRLYYICLFCFCVLVLCNDILCRRISWHSSLGALRSQKHPRNPGALDSHGRTVLMRALELKHTSVAKVPQFMLGPIHQYTKTQPGTAL